ncbi:N-terminal kinase-like protein isoform X2 [Plutella xylostella]|uniref:N-terminal kinase-like protein isoform X1 n=1 Tax=Plutella xylostella TaxID=51655 RepID=UPI0018D04092|nr:N-terminal kinase-like protein isoform X1 [Plutella xylostella]XP_048486189.1 N-terminal kinase-like protein isoform X2 [Plutella xylostella]
MWSFFSRDPTKDFPYEVGDPVRGLEDKTVWTLHKGKKRGTQDEVSIFLFDVQKSSETLFDIAKASLKRLKTMRHPSLLHYLDSCETEKFLYVATECVEPLATHVVDMKLEGQQRDLFLAWGIFQITRALSFLNNDGNMRHNNVCLYSIFVTMAGEWKLGGFEFLTTHGQDSPSGIPIKILPALEIYDPPEKKDPTKLKSVTKCSSDMWGLGCLIWEAFNSPLKNQPSLKVLENIPKQLCSLYCELVSANPASRPNPADIITRCRKMGGYFKNDLIDTMLFLEEIQIKDKVEKGKFFSTLSSHLDSFPEAVCVHKILPQLLTAFHYGDAGSAVLNPMFKLGKLLDEADYQKQIVPCVVKLFASNDRTTRSRLLQQLDQFIMHLQNATVNEQIFPQVVHGFLDTNPTIREQTVKSVVHLAPKLSYNNLNVEVLRHFARLQSKDDQGGIRTNTTVCLGKVAAHLHPQIRQKVLVSAFVRATRDAFPPARQAGVLALAATQQYFLLAEVANRVLPALCPLTNDPEKQVRDAAFRTIRGFLGKLEKVSEDPSLKEGMEADVHTATPSLSNAAATWAGWAVTAVTAKFYRSHSDTARVNPKCALSKPGSLEQPSSSSMSTTTSSVTSMTSLEHSESASDYDPEHWDMAAWGEIDSSAGTGASAKSPASSGSAAAAGGLAALCEDEWDNEEWGTLQEEPTAEAELASPSETWNNSQWADPVLTSVTHNAAATFVRNSLEHRPSHQNSNDSLGGWEDTEFQPIEEVVDGNNASKMEEMRKKREERKLQRQREMEARRNARGQGPMKLGTKIAAAPPPF